MKRSGSFSDEEPEFEAFSSTTTLGVTTTTTTTTTTTADSNKKSSKHVSKKTILESTETTTSSTSAVTATTTATAAAAAADTEKKPLNSRVVFSSDSEDDTDNNSNGPKKAAAKSAGKLLRQQRRNEKRLAEKASKAATDSSSSTPNTPNASSSSSSTSSSTSTPNHDKLYPPSSQPPTPQSSSSAASFSSFLLSPSSPYAAVYGSDARPSLEFKLDQYFQNSNTSHIKLKDIQDLICWVLADGVNQRWVFVKNKPLIKKVVVVLLNNISPGMYSYYHQSFKFLPSRFSVAIPTRCPGSKNRIFSPVHSLLNVPIIKNINKNKSTKEKANAETSLESVYPRTTYVLSVEQLKTNGYPLEPKYTEDETAFTDFVVHQELAAKSTSDDPNHVPMFSIDCEMCKSAAGLELARLSIVNEKSEVLYDEFIKPANEILDYATKYSGITAENLEGVTTTLADAQAAILKHVPENAILIGHSLENDLKVLKMVHYRVIDTALIYSHSRGANFKPSLKWLTETYLKRVIQADESGHNPAEDAIACMQLALLKLKKGPTFGLHEEEHESLFLKISKNGKNGTIIDGPSIVRQHSLASVNCIPSTTDEETLEKTLKAVKSDTDFVYTHFHTLENFFMNAETVGNIDEEQLKVHLASFDYYAKTIFEACIPDSLVIFYTGHGPMDALRKLQHEKEAIGNKWTEAQERALELETMKTRDSLSFIAVK